MEQIQGDLRLQRALLQVDRLRQINDHLGKLVWRVGRIAEERSDSLRRYGDPKYPYLPFSHACFLSAMLHIRKFIAKPEGGRRFLDVGCGIGDKVVLAHSVGFNSIGIESDIFLRRYAKRVFGITDDPVRSNGALILADDVLSHDFSAYDVIYFDGPFQDDRSQRRLERRIFRQAKPSCFVLTPRPLTQPGRRFINFATIDEVHIFRRISKGQSAESSK